MMKFVIALALVFVTPMVYAGECVGGQCSVRSRVVNVTKEVVSVPVRATRKVVSATRNIGRNTVCRVRNILR